MLNDIEKVLLTEEEIKKLQASADKLKSVIAQLDI